LESATTAGVDSVMMSLSPDAIDMVGIFENSVLSVSACADGVVSISNVSAPTVTDARCDSMAKAISRLKGTTLRTGQVAMLPLEADSFDFEVVHVGRDIGELKLAGRRRFGFLAVKRQIIRQIHGGPRDNSAARIGDSPMDGSRAAQGYKRSPVHRYLASGTQKPMSGQDQVIVRYFLSPCRLWTSSDRLQRNPIRSLKPFARLPACNFSIAQLFK
jgi:hypothetical protein